jgi:hypothetical protein
MKRLQRIVGTLLIFSPIIAVMVLGWLYGDYTSKAIIVGILVVFGVATVVSTGFWLIDRGTK